jgi:cytochrome c oxidase assembly protein subunit 15
VIRALQWSALALAFVVLAASSSLRLAANGLSCTPWPACYGKAATAQAVQATASTQALRAIHRVTATVFGLLVLALELFGWRRFNRGERTAALLLLAVTIGLAWLGLYTPSPLPAVTVANVLGGLTLIGLLAWMLSAGRHGSRHALVISALGVALALQATGGALISSRLAGNACALLCERAWFPGAAVLWDVTRAGTAVELLGERDAGQPLVALHALAGLALLLATFMVGAMSGGDRLARRMLLAVAAAVAAGLALIALDSPLALAVLHATLVGGVFASLAMLLAGDSKAAKETAR